MQKINFIVNVFLIIFKIRMSTRCLIINSQLEHEFISSLFYPQAILIDDINEDNVKKKNNEIIIFLRLYCLFLIEK